MSTGVLIWSVPVFGYLRGGIYPFCEGWDLFHEVASDTFFKYLDILYLFWYEIEKVHPFHSTEAPPWLITVASCHFPSPPVSPNRFLRRIIIGNPWSWNCIFRPKVMAERLGSLDSGKVPPLLLLPMYSQLPADLQAKIFDSAEEGVRKWDTERWVRILWIFLKNKIGYTQPFSCLIRVLFKRAMKWSISALSDWSSPLNT